MVLVLVRLPHLERQGLANAAPSGNLFSQPLYTPGIETTALVVE